MRKTTLLFFAALLTFQLFAERTIGGGNSYSEFPFVVFVGQVVDVTQFSVTFENTVYGTTVTNGVIKNLYTALNNETDYVAHGFANALRAASVKDGKMRLTFYLDNLLLIFDDNVTTYMKYIPVYYLFLNNLNAMKLPDKTVEALKQYSIDYYLSLPMAQELMHNSWLAGVFQVNPDNGKLIYKSARFFDNLEELEQSDWAREYRIPGMIRAGLTVSVTKAVYIGNESKDGSLEDVNFNNKKGGKNKPEKKGRFDKKQSAPYGTEK